MGNNRSNVSVIFEENNDNKMKFSVTVVIRVFFSVLVSGCVQFTLFGSGTVYLLLSSQIFQEMFEDIFPGIGFCYWFIIIATAITIPMWLGSPKDFW